MRSALSGEIIERKQSGRTLKVRGQALAGTVKVLVYLTSGIVPLCMAPPGFVAWSIADTDGPRPVFVALKAYVAPKSVGRKLQSREPAPPTKERGSHAIPGIS